jgi:hypothetical protein
MWNGSTNIVYVGSIPKSASDLVVFVLLFSRKACKRGSSRAELSFQEKGDFRKYAHWMFCTLNTYMSRAQSVYRHKGYSDCLLR